MTADLSLESIRSYLMTVREAMARERAFLIALTPTPPIMDRATYVFAYLRAEKIARASIEAALEPIQDVLLARVDLEDEFNQRHSPPLKQWMHTKDTSQDMINSDSPAHDHDSPVTVIRHQGKLRRTVPIAPWSPMPEEAFGNPFVHSLARGGIEYGWDSRHMTWALRRVGRVFHDLACVVSMTRCLTLLRDHGVAAVRLSDIRHLACSAREMATHVWLIGQRTTVDKGWGDSSPTPPSSPMPVSAGKAPRNGKQPIMRLVETTHETPRDQL